MKREERERDSVIVFAPPLDLKDTNGEKASSPLSKDFFGLISPFPPKDTKTKPSVRALCIS